MRRRRDLIRTACALTGVGVVGGLAGCSDDGSDPAQDAAVGHFDEALEPLLENHETLVEWADGEEREESELDGLYANLTDARDSLDDAETVAAEDITIRIGHARDVAAFQEAVLDFYGIGFDFEDRLSDAQAFMDAENNDRAITEYEAARDLLDDARGQYDVMASAHTDIEDGALENEGLDYSGPLSEYVDVDAKGAIDAHDRFVEGVVHFNHAFLTLEEGFGELEADRVVAARERFEDARAEYDDAKAKFDAARTHDDAPDDLRNRAIGMVSTLEDTEGAFDKFVQATHELEAGNGQRAERLVGEGWSLFEEFE
jgi:tetratricopeptide (TPR) repeat protein